MRYGRAQLSQRRRDRQGTNSANHTGNEAHEEGHSEAVSRRDAEHAGNPEELTRRRMGGRSEEPNRVSAILRALHVLHGECVSGLDSAVPFGGLARGNQPPVSRGGAERDGKPKKLAKSRMERRIGTLHLCLSCSLSSLCHVGQTESFHPLQRFPAASLHLYASRGSGLASAPSFRLPQER